MSLIAAYLTIQVLFCILSVADLIPAIPDLKVPKAVKIALLWVLAPTIVGIAIFGGFGMPVGNRAAFIYTTARDILLGRNL